jgi:hypothetical protein
MDEPLLQSLLGSPLTRGGKAILRPLDHFSISEEIAALATIPKRLMSESMTIYIKCCFPDPQDPSTMRQVVRSKSCHATDRVDAVVSEFLSAAPEIPTDNRRYYLGYDQLLFREGSLADCGIVHGKAVELYAPGKNAAVNHNEGLGFVVCSIIPIILGVTALMFSILSARHAVDSASWQAMFLFLGFLLLVPGGTVLVLGLILIPECSMPCYFSGSHWC